MKPKLRVAAVTSLLAMVLSGPTGWGEAPTARALEGTSTALRSNSSSAAAYHLQNQVLGRIHATGLGNSDWGVLAISLEHGDTLVSLNPGHALAPASNQKLFTSAAALHHLGPEFRFPTYLLTDGTIAEGVLHGDLILYGTGDPAISDRMLPSPETPLRAFARALAEAGIHTVTGDVIGDGSFFRGPTRAPTWRDRYLNDWYAAPVSALSFNENVVTLRIRAGAPGGPADVRTIPAGASLPLKNVSMSVAGGVRRPLMLIRDAPDDPIEIGGEVRIGAGEVWRILTVSDPAGFAASVFQRVLAEEGIRVEGSASSLDDTRSSKVSGAQLVAPAFENGTRTPLQTVAVHYSPPVRDLLGVVNKRSHNLYAELLLFALGRMTIGDGSFHGGGLALKTYLTDVVGIAESDLNIEDGSGLSPLNRATAAGFVQLLRHVSNAGYSDDFWASLPEAGNRLELRRMYQSVAAGNLRAKTGTISQVSALSGVVRSMNDELILFSILSNQVRSSGTAKRVEDQIGIQLASFSREWSPTLGEVAQSEYD